MTELDEAIAVAHVTEGQLSDANKVYLMFLRSTLFMPIRKDFKTDEEPFVPLYASEGDRHFIMVFDTLDRLQTWAGDKSDDIDYVGIVGRDVVRSVGEKVYLCLNYGCETYKEFSPEEVQQLKSVVKNVGILQEQHAEA